MMHLWNWKIGEIIIGKNGRYRILKLLKVSQNT